MNGRMYGAKLRQPARRRLEPIENEPWLRVKSAIPILRRICYGAIGVLLMIGIVAALGNKDLMPDAMAPLSLLLACIASLTLLVCLLLLVVAWMDRDAYQYCPDCLSYMTRGAQVCPFCGFRAPSPQGKTFSTPHVHPHSPQA